MNRIEKCYGKFLLEGSYKESPAEGKPEGRCHPKYILIVGALRSKESSYKERKLIRSCLGKGFPFPGNVWSVEYGRQVLGEVKAFRCKC